jgi:hypothetical protein
MLRPLAVFALIIALGLAACGGDDEIESSPTDSASPSTTASITAATSPSPSPSPGLTLEQLAYIAPDGGLWLVNSDGTTIEDHGECGGRLVVGLTTTDRNYLSIVVFDTDGVEIWRADGLGDASPPLWSTDGRRIAYRTEDYSLHVVDVYDGTDTVVEQDAEPLGWLGINSLLVGLDLEVGEAFRTYKAYVIDLSTGDRQPLPYFDADAGAGRRLWLAPDRQIAAVAESGHGTAPIVIYDFASGEDPQTACWWWRAEASRSYRVFARRRRPFCGLW